MSTLRFIGVSAAGSLLREVFPRWAGILGIDAELVGVDLPADCPPEALRAAVAELAEDDDCLGAVVGSLKTRLFHAAAPDFDRLDPAAREYREINAIRSVGGQLEGFARGPVAVGRVVDDFWPDLDADLLCLGSGGTAISLGRHLLDRGQRGRLRFIDHDPSRTRYLLGVLAHGRLETETIEGPYDELVAEASPGTLIVNATDSGQNRPSSPVTARVEFPPDCVFWDFHHCGDLRMLVDAQRQAAAKGLRVHGGESLFCHGWAAALSAVLGLPDDPELGEAFAAALPT